MDLSGLTNWLQTQMAHLSGGQPFQGSNGTLYGPAVQRQTRVPITYDPTAGGTAGVYNSGGLIHPEGMTIYPNSRIAMQDGSTSPTIEHEMVHAAQSHAGQLGNGSMVPGYADVAKAIAPNVAGRLEAEAPADAISYDPRFTPGLSRGAADTYGKAVIAATPVAQQPALQSSYDSARARLDANDATLAAKAKQ